MPELTAKQKLQNALAGYIGGQIIADAVENLIIEIMNRAATSSAELQGVRQEETFKDKCIHNLLGTKAILENKLDAQFDQIQSLKDRLKEANEALQNRFTRCTYCGFRIDYFAEDGHDKALEEMRQHALVCKQDPHVQEISKLKERNDTLIHDYAVQKEKTSEANYANDQLQKQMGSAYDEIDSLKRKLKEATAANQRGSEVLNKTREELDQCRTQLAGCLMAAEGGTKEPTIAHQGEYGWSLAYEKTLELRRSYDALKEELAEWKRMVDKRWHDGYETGFLKAKESDTVSNVSKPTITSIPEGWESARFSPPDDNRMVEIMWDDSKIAKGCWSDNNWHDPEYHHIFGRIVCWREIQPDTVSIPDLHVGDTIWIKGTVKQLNLEEGCVLFKDGPGHSFWIWPNTEMKK